MGRAIKKLFCLSETKQLGDSYVNRCAYLLRSERLRS